MKTHILFAFALTFATQGCNDPHQRVAAQQATVVYGQDDRLDTYQLSDSPADLQLRNIADSAIAAMFYADDLLQSAGRITLPDNTLGESYDLCEDQRFYSQPSGALCSGTLIADDLILTAGHCVTSQQECEGFSWVFNYQMDGPETPRAIYPEDVFECEELVTRFDGYTANNRLLDYAIVRLNRSAAPDFQPVALGFPHSIQQGARVTVLGFGAGLPLKVDEGGEITNARSYEADYFVATTDTFGGNSGSGVFNANLELVGILVRGNADFQYDDERQCNIVNQITSPIAYNFSEQITYAQRAITALCEEEEGNPLCDLREVPPAWTCAPEHYADATYCDCDCGIADPDCDTTGRTTRGCGDDEPTPNDENEPLPCSGEACENPPDETSGDDSSLENCSTAGNNGSVHLGALLAGLILLRRRRR